jgi:hypothetical protein
MDNTQRVEPPEPALSHHPRPKGIQRMARPRQPLATHVESLALLAFSGVRLSRR